ncbi:MAG: primosomal protein N' [Patescibacteria group bacterium]
MLADIIPAIRLPRNLTTFTYKVKPEQEKQIKVGQIVQIYFRQKKVQGLVIKVRQDASQRLSFPLKPIEAIVDFNPLFTTSQFELSQWLSNNYFVAPSLVIKSMLPQIPRHKTAVNRLPAIGLISFTAQTVPLPNLNQKVLLKYFTDAYKNNFIYSLIVQTIKNNKQVLILVPQVDDLIGVGGYLDNNLRNLAVFLTNNLNKNTYYQAWQKIISGQAKIIIGTRSAVFSPLVNLGLIVLENEHDSSYKQWDQNPRYDAREVSLELARLVRAKIVFASYAPRVETYYLAKNKNDFGYIEEKNNSRQVIPIDLAMEIKSGNYSLLSEQLTQKIIEAKVNKQKVVLYLNRRGVASFVVCGDCQYVFTCHNCQTALPYHRDGKLVCHHCGFDKNLPASCPNCQGQNFKFPGRGTQKLENQLQTIWPGCRILRLDGDVDLKKIDQQKIDLADIYLGTEMVFKKVNWQSVGVVAILFMDNIFYVPEFRSAEKIWQILNLLLTKSIFSLTSKIYFQTFKIDHPIIRNFIAGQSDLFYQREIAERQLGGYPPFGYLAKLIYRHSSRSIAENRANSLYQELTKIAEKDKMLLQISPPALAYTQKIRGRFEYKIILRSSVVMNNILKNIPDDWLIDVQPESLL